METIKNIPQETLENPLLKSAESLRAQSKDTEEFVRAIGKFIRRHADTVPNPYVPATIVESRFMPTDEAFKKGVLTCGSLSNISAEMLRHVGYKVKLVHGECEQSVDHAWISVFVPEKSAWVEYDLAFKDATITPFHIKKAEVDSWEEIRGQVESDHETLRERRRDRGLKEEF